MKCERALAWLSDYVDGSIDPARRVVLEAHLAACPSCQRELAGLRELWNGLAAMPGLEPPPTLRATIWQRIEATEGRRAEQPHARPRSVFLLWGRLAAAAAALVAVALLARVTIPGSFRSAGWSFWLGRGQSSSHVSGEQWRVGGTGQLLRAGQTGAVTDTVRVTLRIAGQARPGRIVLEGPAGEVADRKITLTPPGITVDVPVPADAERPLEVKVEWYTRGGDAKASMTLPVRQ